MHWETPLRSTSDGRPDDYTGGFGERATTVLMTGLMLTLKMIEKTKFKGK